MTDRSWLCWGIALGFALGGFFDGILLHQILQWHHLLSLVPSVDTIRAQVMWDGYFHALMYGIAAVALWGLWRRRVDVHQQPGRALVGVLLAGFGGWHTVDSVLSHWLLGIHRIRLHSSNPLAWDIGWFAAFGLVPLVIGWLLLRRGGPAKVGRNTTAAILGIGLLTTGAAAWSAQPLPGQPLTTVVFAPWVRPAEVMNALARHDARLVWADPRRGVVVVHAPRTSGLHFYRRGALLVSGSGLPSGCFNWSRA